MYIVVGLGNPGNKYKNTRHNIGFMVADCLAEAHNIKLSPGKGDYFQGKGFIQQESVLIVKPTTYMNLSGIAVKKVLHYYQIPPENALIVCDDFNLPFGKIRLRSKGSDGGQKGLASIICHINTDIVNRLRIGIDDGGIRGDNASFVLGNFPRSAQKHLHTIIETAADAAVLWMKNGVTDAMSFYNGMEIT